MSQRIWASFPEYRVWPEIPLFFSTSPTNLKFVDLVFCCCCSFSKCYNSSVIDIEINYIIFYDLPFVLLNVRYCFTESLRPQLLDCLSSWDLRKYFYGFAEGGRGCLGLFNLKPLENTFHKFCYADASPCLCLKSFHSQSTVQNNLLSIIVVWKFPICPRDSRNC